MTDPRPPHEVFFDVVVYAPLGIAITAVEQVPRLAELGRSRFEKRIVLAGALGKLALGKARGRGPRPNRSPAPTRGFAPSAPSEPSTPTRGSRAQHAPEPTRSPPAVATRTGSREKAGRALPIPAYDTLAASQVVERLGALSRPELEAVRSYEAAGRRRRTVLHRIAQLSAPPGPLGPG